MLSVENVEKFFSVKKPKPLIIGMKWVKMEQHECEDLYVQL